MTKFYIVWHGQTDYNKSHRIQGKLDVPLNGVGKEQARKIADDLAGINFDAIYYSSLTRAKQTANEIYKNHKNAKYIEAPEIVERNFGDYEEEFVADKPACFELWNRDRELELVKNGETMDDMKRRIFPFLDKLAFEHKDETICLVCHGGTSLIIREYFEGMPESGNLLDFPPIQNGGVVIFEK